MRHFLFVLLFVFSTYSFSEDNLTSAEEICNSAENEIKDLELIKKTLRKSLKI